MKICNLVSGKLKKEARGLCEFYIWAHGTIMWYVSADALFWQLSIDHEMDLPCKISKI